MSAPLLSAVIVNWNAGDAIFDCLRSLADQSLEGPIEAIVVDNGSTDGSVDTIRRDFPWVRLVVNPSNRGLPAANNQGMVAARADLLLICNPDVVFLPGAVAAMLATLARHPRAGFVIPRMRYDDGTLATSAGDLPRLRDALFGRQALRWAAPGSPSGFWWDGWSHDEERAIGRGHEAAYLVRRETIIEVGVQDERFALDWEGVDWTARVRQAGWEVWISPDAEVIHLGGASIRQVPRRWIISSHLGMYRYFAKERPRWQRPLLAVAIAGRAGLKLSAGAAGAAVYDRGHRSPTRRSRT